MKPFLLIAGDYQYPNVGTEDWIGTFETREEAESYVTEGEEHSLFNSQYKLKNGDRANWYKIVDLRDWI